MKQSFLAVAKTHTPKGHKNNSELTTFGGCLYTIAVKYFILFKCIPSIFSKNWYI